MEEKLKILLVEDDPVVCAEFAELLDDHEHLKLVDVTNNSEKAEECVRDALPDAVILDIELHYGKGDGIFFLRRLTQLSLPKFPYILVTTNNTSITTYNYIRTLGVDYIMSKHQDGYSSRQAVDFLTMMKDIILEKGKSMLVSLPFKSPEQNRISTRRRIAAELDLIGISPKMIGYQYLEDSIYLVINGETKSIPRVVAEMHGKTAASVERAMQNAINKAWRRADINDLLKIYTAPVDIDRGVPTLTEFIYHYARKLGPEYTK